MGSIIRKITRYGIELDDHHYYSPDMACLEGLVMEIDLPEDCETMPFFLKGKAGAEVFTMQLYSPGENTYFRLHKQGIYMPLIQFPRALRSAVGRIEVRSR